ncbi:MAG TPA: hypothetical protein VEG60_07820 [Candidatus Binatia bacterium]|nr:hypothetical protein [Candidatus Binatia bacterium]
MEREKSASSACGIAKRVTGPGGTKHLRDAIVQGSGKAYVFDTTQLW